MVRIHALGAWVSDGEFERIEAVWTGCQWRVTGREVVTTMRRI
ncbi:MULTISPECIES: hypothetical protein [unclassified Haloarcula]